MLHMFSTIGGSDELNMYGRERVELIQASRPGKET